MIIEWADLARSIKLVASRFVETFSCDCDCWLLEDDDAEVLLASFESDGFLVDSRRLQTSS